MKKPKLTASQKWLDTALKGRPSRPAPLLLQLALTQPEIQTLHQALEHTITIGRLLDAPNVEKVFFLVAALELELQGQLGTDRTGVLCWLNGRTKEEAR